MKKLLTIGALSLALFACGKNEETTKTNVETITVSVQNEKEELINLEVPKNPKRIVILDYLALDHLKTWGLENNVVGMAKSAVPNHLKSIAENDKISHLGSLKEIDMEEIMSLQPDIIFISGRTRSRYQEFSKIAPTVMSSIDYEKGTMESYKEIALRNAAIFGQEEETKNIIDRHEKRVANLKEKANGSTSMLGIIIGGNLKTLGNKSRGAIIGNELGFKNLSSKVNSTHGNSSSFELLLKQNPEYIFIIDKDKAISLDNTSKNGSVLDNEIIYQTDAYKNNKIIYLNSNAWYTAEGGLQTMDIMLDDIASAFENNK